MTFNAEEILDAMSASPADPERKKHALGVVYNELVKIARAELAKHRRGATLDTRGLVNEAYLKLFGGSPRVYENRKHFYATAAVAMRQVVIDYARQRLAERRGGGKRGEHTSLDALEGEPLSIDAEAERLVQIDMALTRLSKLDERLVQIVEMRFFGGLEVTEIAELLGVSEATIKRDTRAARAFLERELEPGT